MKLFIKMLLPVLIVTFFFSQSILGEEKVKLLPLTPLPAKSTVKILKNEYREPIKVIVDGKGLIDRIEIEKNDIVINDTLWKIASYVTVLLEPSGHSFSIRSLKKGQMVEFVLNKKREISTLRVFKK